MSHTLQTKEDVYIDAMVEMVEAVNGAFSEENLLRLYQLTLIGHLGLSRFVLWVEEDSHWVPKASQGIAQHLPEGQVRRLSQAIQRPGKLEGHPPGHALHGYTYAIPVLRRAKANAQTQASAAAPTVIALLLLGGGVYGLQAHGNLIKFLNAVTHLMTLAIYNRRLEAIERQQERMAIELEFAEKVQLGLYPKYLPNEGPLKAAASMIGFGKVSGDYYDFIPLGGQRYLICLADVSGKGMGAALLMANFQAGLRALVRHTTHLEALLAELNTVILHNGRGDKFVTAFLGLVDMRQRKLTYINAAHPPALLCLPSGEIKALSTGTTLVGIFDALHNIEVGRESLPPGFRLIMYTDGVSETFNPAREEFGEERLMQIINQTAPSEGLDTLHAHILDALEAFRQGAVAEDDITLFSLQG